MRSIVDGTDCVHEAHASKYTKDSKVLDQGSAALATAMGPPVPAPSMKRITPTGTGERAIHREMSSCLSIYRTLERLSIRLVSFSPLPTADPITHRNPRCASAQLCQQAAAPAPRLTSAGRAATIQPCPRARL